MEQAALIRIKTSDEGTFGELKFPGGFSCKTLELPWRENQRSVSCIAPGRYECRYIAETNSGKFHDVYHVENVQGRTGILIHPGNYAGDESKGYLTDVQGCILPGMYYGELGSQQAVIRSQDAMHGLLEYLNREPFLLWVIDLTRETT